MYFLANNSVVYYTVFARFLANTWMQVIVQIKLLTKLKYLFCRIDTYKVSIIICSIYWSCERGGGYSLYSNDRDDRRIF